LPAAGYQVAGFTCRLDPNTIMAHCSPTLKSPILWLCLIT
jgi:hypothetical protein